MKINVITLCSGYDSQCMALDELKKLHPDFDYDLIAWSEIDKDAIRSHNAIYPQWADRNVGDMTKVNWSQFRGTRIDLLTYSTPCLTADSLILTKEGYKEIGKVGVGDWVLTKSNTWHKVAKKFDNGVHPTMFVNAMGFENIHCTPNHKFYIRTKSRKWDKENRKYTRVFSAPGFKEAKDITKGDYFGIPVNENGELPKWNGVEDNRFGHHGNKNAISALLGKKDFWYLMGRYVGDGWKRDDDLHKNVIICCGGRNERKLEDAIASCGYNVFVSKERTANKYQIASKELCEFIGRFGYLAKGKRIDGETMNLPVSLLESFLEGCFDSDGCKTQGQQKYFSASRELIYGISYCINKVYKRHTRIGISKRRPTTVIEGREVNQMNGYQLSFTKDAKSQDHAFYEDGYIWYPFKDATQGNAEHVYNIEVEEDHSYVVQGSISKNCTDISNAGQQKGLEEGTGTRSSILWYTRNAILELQPKYLMMENVKALVSKKFLPYFLKWVKELENYGYDTEYKVVNATEFGVAQNRERVFAISTRIDSEDEPRYKFPQPIPLTKTIEDYLEDEVDEKYYLKEEQVNKFLDMINDNAEQV